MKRKIVFFSVGGLLLLAVLFRVSLSVWLHKEIDYGDDPRHSHLSDGEADFALAAYYFIGDSRVKDIAQEEYHPTDDEMNQFQEEYLRRRPGVDPQKIGEHAKQVVGIDPTTVEVRISQIGYIQQVRLRLVQRVQMQIKEDFDSGKTDAWTALYALDHVDIPELK